MADGEQPPAQPDGQVRVIETLRRARAGADRHAYGHGELAPVGRAQRALPLDGCANRVYDVGKGREQPIAEMGRQPATVELDDRPQEPVELHKS
ncbi:MAG TPA: hypothetical protein VFG86_28335 [Chloroflexota bacterium]|jgi:hypothetical protein|nr:hypothetical protein [Chloroflexota bacterium]